MTVKEFMQLTPEDLTRMSEKELRETVRTMASAANKRLRRLGETKLGRSAPGYKAAMKRGAFSSKGKNRSQLLGEATREMRFFNYKTGSVRGWEKYQRDVYNRMRSKFEQEEKKKPKSERKELLPYNEIDKEKFWEIYRKYEEQHPDEFVNNTGSPEIYMDMVDMMSEIGYIDLELINLMEGYDAAGRPMTEEEIEEELHKRGLNIKKRGRRKGLWEE